MTYTIHVLGPGDAGLLTQVAEDVFDDEIDTGLLTAYLADPGHAMAVAVENGVVIGQGRAILNRQPDAATALFLDNLGVTPDQRRRGIATALVKALMQWGHRYGCQSLWVPLETDNAEARAFYASLGLHSRPILIAEGPLL
ncbi:GNAT family N-acetyltransferase [Niveispirillum lacus]|nr:GNAT family N-acetyltransferase [Niveispirillum lacus]